MTTAPRRHVGPKRKLPWITTSIGGFVDLHRRNAAAPTSGGGRSSGKAKMEASSVGGTVAAREYRRKNVQQQHEQIGRSCSEATIRGVRKVEANARRRGNKLATRMWHIQGFLLQAARPRRLRRPMRFSVGRVSVEISVKDVERTSDQKWLLSCCTGSVSCCTEHTRLLCRPRMVSYIILVNPRRTLK